MDSYWNFHYKDGTKQSFRRICYAGLHYDYSEHKDKIVGISFDDTNAKIYDCPILIKYAKRAFPDLMDDKGIIDVNKPSDLVMLMLYSLRYPTEYGYHSVVDKHIEAMKEVHKEMGRPFGKLSAPLILALSNLPNQCRGDKIVTYSQWGHGGIHWDILSVGDLWHLSKLKTFQSIDKKSFHERNGQYQRGEHSLATYQPMLGKYSDSRWASSRKLKQGDKLMSDLLNPLYNHNGLDPKEMYRGIFKIMLDNPVKFED